MTSADPFPAKDAHLLPELESLLKEAAERGRAGEILREEELITAVRSVAEKSPIWRRRHVVRWIDRAIDQRVNDGLLRAGAVLIGHVKGEVSGDIVATFYGLRIYSDRLLIGQTCRVMDASVSVAIEVDGQLVVSHRPTMTRMAAGAALPGSALLVGLATQKRIVNDGRSAQLVVAHPEWVVAIQVKPEAVPDLRPIAARVNSIADSMSNGAQPVASSESKLDQLERLNELLKSGAISEVQAANLREEILES